MKICAIDENGKAISIDEFFSKYAEFSLNRELSISASRFLKVLLRHWSNIDYIAEKSGNNYCYKLYGDTRTYTIVFGSEEKDTIVLKNLLWGYFIDWPVQSITSPFPYENMSIKLFDMLLGNWII